MKMSSTLLFFTTVLSGTVGVMPTFAADPATSAQAETSQKSAPMTDADKQEYKSMLKEAFTMMGHVGVANIALLYNMTDEATDNVQKALTIARKLEGQTTQLNADVIKLGKLKYHSASGDTGATHDYWLPMANDTLVVTNLDSEYLKSKQPKAAEEDAQIVNTKVALNVKQVRDSLEKAASAISRRNYGDAQLALLNAEQSTFVDETISELPLVTARDNLALARELAKSKDYDGASFALNHAKDALKEYQKTVKKEKSAQVENLQTEISDLQMEIAKDKHSMAADFEKHISAWIHKIEDLGAQKD
jgi:hypothetical protein